MSPQTQEESRKQRMSMIHDQMAKLEFLMKKIDRDIGYNFWKKYVASAFWSQISTPINLVITFLTAITTAQAQSPDLIPQSIYSQLAIVSLIITTLNTFFRPHTQFATNTEFLQKWNDIGIRFEKEYYDKIIITQNSTDEEITAVKEKIKTYEKIQDDMNVLRKSEGTTTVNFLTDLIFLLCYSTCIRNYKRWLSHDQKIAKDMDEETLEKRKRDQKNELVNERLKSDMRIQIEELKQQEELELMRLKERHKRELKMNKDLYTVQDGKPPTESVFDLFDKDGSLPSSPPSPHPPPPPTQIVEPPPLSIDQVVKVTPSK